MPDPVPLRTVRVPSDLEEVFASAEQLVSSYFAARREDPERGTIEISGDRFVLVRASSLSVEFFALVEELYGPGRDDEARTFAANLLFDLAHALGRKDAASFHERNGLEDPLARLSAGPVHFAHAGWAFVDILDRMTEGAPDDFLLVYEHPYSFEADAWLRAGRHASTGTCIMNAGYSSGWCQESLGVPLVAAEIRCRALGAKTCRFVMAPPHRIEERARAQAPASTTIIPDLFARKRLEDELRRAREDLEVRVQERTAALLREVEERRRVERLLHHQSKLEALGRLAGGIAHDFNNVLAIVTMNARLCARTLPPDDPRHHQLTEISHACGRAADLTRQLLAFGGVNRGSTEIAELDRSVVELGKMLGRLAGDEVHVRVAAEAPGIAVGLPRSHVDQILVNLFVNARDAMPGGGVLTVSTEAADVDDARARELGVAAGAYALLSVRDTGVGMDETTRAVIFEPFFSTKPDGAGAGLGLSTVYGIVKQAKGTITVESNVGRGSVFRVYLPVREGEPSTSSTSSNPPRSDVPQGRGQLVLVVEDQAPVRDALAALVEALGYRVVAVADVRAALVTLRGGEPVDVVLSDVELPRVSGIALAEDLERAAPRTPIVLMSGNPGGPHVARAPRSATFLSKPFDEITLAKALAKALQSKGA